MVLTETAGARRSPQISPVRQKIRGQTALSAMGCFARMKAWWIWGQSSLSPYFLFLTTTAPAPPESPAHRTDYYPHDPRDP